MRFGQISPNLSATTESSVKNLIAARNMKSQAMRGVVSFVNKAADEKIQKEKDAAAVKRATELLGQVQSAFPNNPAIQALNMETLAKDFGKEGIGIMNMMAQATLNQKQAEAQIAAAVAAKSKSTHEEQVARNEEAERLRLAKENEITERLTSSTLSEFFNRVTKTDEEGKTVSEMPTATERYNFVSGLVDEQISMLSPVDKDIVDRDDIIREALSSTYEIGSKEAAREKSNMEQRLFSQELENEIQASQNKADELARSSAQGLNKVARATDNNLIQIDSILDDAQELEDLIKKFAEQEGVYDGVGPLTIDPRLSDSLRAAISEGVRGSVASDIKAMASGLAAKLGVEALMNLRSTSVDGSSGFGQLTGIELQGLQSLVGVLGTIEDNKFTPVSLQTMTRTLSEVKRRFTDRKQSVLFDFEANYGDLMNQSGLYPQSKDPEKFGVRRGFSVLGSTAVPL